METNAWVLFFFLFPWLSKKLSQLPNLELDSLLSRFCGPVRTKNSINGVYKTNIDCSFIRGMVENYCTLGKIQPWPTRFTSALWASVNSRPRLNFTSDTILFHHSPHEQSIFVYYTHHQIGGIDIEGFHVTSLQQNLPSHAAHSGHVGSHKIWPNSLLLNFIKPNYTIGIIM